MIPAVTVNSPKPGWLFALGIVYVLAGILAVASPLMVTLITVLFFGVILLVTGIAGLIHTFWVRGWDALAVQLLAGILAAVMGFLLIVDAEAGAVVITLILGSYFLISGLFRLAFAIAHPHLRHRTSLLFSGVVTVLLGILIAVHWPSSSTWVIGTFIGIDLIFYGISLISAGRNHA